MRQLRFTLLVALLAWCRHLPATEPPSNWTGNYAPCDRHAELLKPDHMDLGVRFSSTNPRLIKQFKRALDFWAGVVDMSWHEEDSGSCSIQLVDGDRTLFKPGEALIARSQFVNWQNFQGWIAFDPRVPLTSTEMYLTAVHEIGHMLGLQHSHNPDSVMYFLNRDDGSELLDAADLAALATNHKLRDPNLFAPVALNKQGFFTRFKIANHAE